MQEWTYAQTSAREELAQLHYFSMKKRQVDGEVEFIITVREYVTPRDPAMRFFAIADKQTNQKTAPYTPCAWGNSLLQALADCVKNVHLFPYEPQGGPR